MRLLEYGQTSFPLRLEEKLAGVLKSEGLMGININRLNFGGGNCQTNMVRSQRRDPEPT